MIKRLFSILIISTISIFPVVAQGYIIDQVIAVIGGEKVSQGDLDELYTQMRAENRTGDLNQMRCTAFENILTKKLLLAQSKIDSIEVDNGQLELQLNQRIDYFSERIGSQEKMEDYFGKSMREIKDDLRVALSEEMISNQERGLILADISVTPNEVRKWYKSLPEDSIPLIPAKYMISEIAVYPPYAESSVTEIRERLLSLRKRILEGERFSSLAVLYSEDPGSAMNGGELGFMNKGELEPAYAKTAWALKPNEVSRIVETPFGFHIIQMIEKRGELANTRHILMKPKPTAEETSKAIARLDSISESIRKGDITYEQAVRLFSEEKTTRYNNGYMINKNASSIGYGGIWFELGELSATELRIVRNLKPYEISDPYETVDSNGRTIYKIIKIVNTSEPHKANPEDDYDLLRTLYTNKKENNAIRQWIKDKAESHYVRIDPSVSNCPFLEGGWLN